MQDRYVGDVGDFGKFGLLRHLLLGQDNLISPGVVWYYYAPHDEDNNDGCHTNFHTNTVLTSCDPKLAEALQHISTTRRCVAALEDSQILPAQTRYFREDTNFYAAFPDQTQKNKIARQAARDRWLKQALQAVQGCQMIFLDPDNGLEIASCSRKSQKKAGKFAFLDEIRAFKDRSPVVIVYHHLNMGSPHELQIEKGVARLVDTFQREISVFSLRFRPYSPRAFFILCSSNTDEDVARRLINFQHGPWGQYWDNFNV